MIVTLESTDKVVNLNGIPARVWVGKTSTGLKLHAYLTRIAVDENEDQQEFEKELAKCNKPTPSDIQAIPSKLIL